MTVIDRYFVIEVDYAWTDLSFIVFRIVLIKQASDPCGYALL